MCFLKKFLSLWLNKGKIHFVFSQQFQLVPLMENFRFFFGSIFWRIKCARIFVLCLHAKFRVVTFSFFHTRITFDENKIKWKLISCSTEHFVTRGNRVVLLFCSIRVKYTVFDYINCTPNEKTSKFVIFIKVKFNLKTKYFFTIKTVRLDRHISMNLKIKAFHKIM